MGIGSIWMLKEFANIELFTRLDTDMADRLNHIYTTTILVFLSTVVLCKQYVGDPIQCWTPQHFTKHHDAFTNDYCWISNTYYLPFTEPIPEQSTDDSVSTKIVYYQWVPVLLCVQAFLFCLPRIFWMTFSDHSGVELGSFIDCGKLITVSQMETSIREKLFSKMTKQVDRYLWSSAKNPDAGVGAATLSIKHCLNRTVFRRSGVRFANYLITVYLFTKVFYVANIVCQLLVLNAFLGSAFTSYGVEVIRTMTQGADWMMSPRFPRLTMCNFNVRRLGTGNIHHYAVQCVLPINLFNEKIFLFIWFWYVLVATVTCVSTLAWIFRASTYSERHRYVRRYLNIAGKIKLHDKVDRANSVKFIDEYLRQDGVLLLRLLSGATNGMVAMEMTAALWENYFNKPEIVALTIRTVSTASRMETAVRQRPATNKGQMNNNGPPTYYSLDIRDKGSQKNKPRTVHFSNEY